MFGLNFLGPVGAGAATNPQPGLDSSPSDLSSLAKAYAASKGIRPKVGAGNYAQAQADLQLTPQERSLYERHLTNLNGPGGVDNADGSRSTLYQSVQQHDGKFYSVPTVWNGKRETEKYTRPDGSSLDVPNATALANVDAAGWKNFPAYNTPEEADARYEKMHSYMDKDTAEHMANKATPAQRVANGWDQFGPQASQPQAPMLPTPPTPAPVDMGTPTPPQAPAAPPALSAQAMAPPPAPQAPMPLARPADAPAPMPDMGFFARNAAMQRDPSSGQFIDPVNAERAQASGPDVINKLMSYFHNKGNPSD